MQKDLESSGAKLASLEKAHQASLADADTAHASAIKAKNAEIAKKDEEIGTLKVDLKKARTRP